MGRQWPAEDFKEIAPVVMEVTDDKSLPKQARKQLQIDHASTLNAQAKVVKLADKICNLRDMSRSPPHDWSVQRRARLPADTKPGQRAAWTNPGAVRSMPTTPDCRVPRNPQRCVTAAS
jgi:uncharacterized protein (UPF0147 family)